MHQAISIKQFHQIRELIKRDLIKAEQERDRLLSLEGYRIKLENAKSDLVKESYAAKESLYLLKDWYSRHKNEKINQLQEDINTILKSFFGGKYNLTLKKSIVRGKEVLELIDTNTDGSSPRSVALMLSGAERQLAGFLVQSTTLINLDSNLLILDEAFSSLGEEEIKRVPELLQELTGVQMVIIEHKSQLFEDVERKVIELESIAGITNIKQEYFEEGLCEENEVQRVE